MRGIATDVGCITGQIGQRQELSEFSKDLGFVGGTPRANLVTRRRACCILGEGTGTAEGQSEEENLQISYAAHRTVPSQGLSQAQAGMWAGEKLGEPEGSPEGDTAQYS
ncbi:MAG TPA: hypothetical protein VNK82_14500 [Terriglobales bacterium]|nr:hypothetical protein [Terriglobales bacterium]